jgi:hypothetical protein
MLARREFLKSALGTGVALAAGFSQEAAAQPMRRRLIVDAQVHGGRPQPQTARGFQAQGRSFRNHSPSRGWFP